MAGPNDTHTPDGSSTLELIRFLARESGPAAYRITATSIVSGFSRGLILATFNAAAVLSAEGSVEPWLLAAFVGALVVHLLTKFDSSRQGIRLMHRMVRRLRLRLCESLLFSQLRFVEAKGPAAVYAHVSADVTLLGRSALRIIQNIESAIVLFFAFTYLAWLSPAGLFAGIVMLFVSIVIYRAQDRKASAKLREARRKEEEFFKGIYDLVQGFKELKLTRARHTSLADQLQRVSNEYRRATVEGATLHQVTIITSEAFIFALIGIFIFVLPALFPSTSTSVFQFLATVLFMIAPVEQLLHSAEPISHARIALGKIATLERELEAGMTDPAGRDAETTPFQFETIELKDVHFRFENFDEGEIFDLGPINLKLHRGEILFICGGNGAGKTTLLKLLTGLYYPESGSLLIDGRKVELEEKQRYREMFAAVFGDFYLFQKLYGIDSPDPKHVGELLNELNLHNKTRLEDDRFTTINLSTGQRKRLAYAVSRLSDRQIYVFDEFAADQDPGFRRYFYEDLLPELKRQGKTVVAVTHDDRWFHAGDRLVKLDYGKIVEEALAF